VLKCVQLINAPGGIDQDR